MLKRVFALLSLSFAMLAAPVQAQIKIGFVGTLSGPAGSLGLDMYDAFMLGIEHSGGRLGGQPVQVLREDDQLKIDHAIQVVEKLVKRERVPIITGITFSNVMMAVYKPIVDAEVFLIGSNAGPSDIAGKMCSPYFFSTSWENSQQHEAVGQFATARPYGRMVIVAPNYQGGKDALAGFKRFYRGQLLEEIYTKLNQPDYSVEIAQIRAKSPDAVFAFLPGAMGINFVKQYNQAGLLGKLPLLSAATIDGTSLPALNEVALGAMTGTVWGPDFDNPQNRRFVTDFEKKHGRIPSQYAAQSYDAALLLDSAIRKVDGKVSDKRAFQAALKAADFRAVRGPVKYNNNNFLIQDFHIFEVAKRADGRISLATRSKVLPAHVDSQHSACPMK